MKVRIIKKHNPNISKTLTLKQQKVVSLMSVNVGKSKADVLRKAGYAPSVVNNPDHVFNSPIIKDALNSITEKMQVVCEKALDVLVNKSMEKESAYNLAIISSIMTKNIELLSGRPTNRTEYELPDEEKVRLDKLLKLNKRK